jgi:hypothetical protein
VVDRLPAQLFSDLSYLFIKVFQIVPRFPLPPLNFQF